MFSLDQILQWTGGHVVNREVGRDACEGVSRISALRGAREGDLCFFFSKEYQHELSDSRPGILITGEKFVGALSASGLPLWSASVVVACRDPYLAMARVSAQFAGLNESREFGEISQGIHPTAVVHPSAKLADGASVGPHCVVERDAVIGENSRLVAGVFLGVGSTIGRDCLIFPHVTIYHGCRIGDRARIHSGVVIGSDGFGYAPEKSEGKAVGHAKIHHLGGVVIGSDVEIGACTAVDRGTIGDTLIEDLVKIDNLVQVGHNSVLRKGAVLCGMSGVAGGSTVGRFAYLGGRAIVINKAEVGDGSMLAADTVVTKDVGPGEQVAGSPHRPLREHLKIQAKLSRMLESRNDSKGENS
jgi:UDP-3-O-[3-hydroxymyristoyl] glucosamine N-acyltransferase